MSAIDCGSLVMTLGNVCTIIECIISRGIGNERCFQILICGNLHANACDDDRSLIVAQNAACIREFDAFFIFYSPNCTHRTDGRAELRCTKKCWRAASVIRVDIQTLRIQGTHVVISKERETLPSEVPSRRPPE